MYFDRNNPKPIYEQIVMGIKKDIVNAVYLPGEQLPSVREQAKILGINPNTISKAYKELESQEIIVTIRGKGTFVKELFSEELTHKDQTKLKQQLNEWIIEAYYANVSKELITQWVIEETRRVFDETN